MPKSSSQAGRLCALALVTPACTRDDRSHSGCRSQRMCRHAAPSSATCACNGAAWRLAWGPYNASAARDPFTHGRAGALFDNTAVRDARLCVCRPVVAANRAPYPKLGRQARSHHAFFKGPAVEAWFKGISKKEHHLMPCHHGRTPNMLSCTHTPSPCMLLRRAGLRLAWPVHAHMCGLPHQPLMWLASLLLCPLHATDALPTKSSFRYVAVKLGPLVQGVRTRHPKCSARTHAVSQSVGGRAAVRAALRRHVQSVT